MSEKHWPHIIRLRTTDELAAGFGTQDENQDFRLAVDRAAQTRRGTLVLSQDGDPLAVIVGAATNRARLELGEQDAPDALTRISEALSTLGVLADAPGTLSRGPVEIERWLRGDR